MSGHFIFDIADNMTDVVMDIHGCFSPVSGLTLAVSPCRGADALDRKGNPNETSQIDGDYCGVSFSPADSYGSKRGTGSLDPKLRH